MDTTRRRFLKAAAITGSLVCLPVKNVIAKTDEPVKNADQQGMLYDSTLCVGCKACVYSCRAANFDLDNSSKLSREDEKETKWFNPQDLDYRTFNIIKKYEDSQTKEFAFIKRQCNHCAQPGCVSACPVKAMIKNPDTGIVEYDKSKCIGCRYCQIACPFNVPSFEWHLALPKISKCELCKNTNLLTKGLPACVEVCPTKAVIYGKRGELLNEARKRIGSNPDKYINKIYGEKDYGGTNVLYISGVDFKKLGLPDIGNTSSAEVSENLQHTIYKTFMGVPIAPFVLYGAIVGLALRNKNQRDKNKEDKGGKDE